jgi:ribA/ribD-fused uncharacterized protein
MSPHGCFSNFARYGFELNGAWWPTCEQFYQAQKYVTTRHATVIRLADSPRRAADLGRDPSKPLRWDWEQVKVDVIRRAVKVKFDTTPTSAKSSATCDQDIVEDSHPATAEAAVAAAPARRPNAHRDPGRKKDPMVQALVTADVVSG